MRHGRTKNPGPVLPRTAPQKEFKGLRRTVFEKSSHQDLIERQPRINVARTTAFGGSRGETFPTYFSFSKTSAP